MSLIKRVFTRALSKRILVGPNKRLIFIYHDVSNPDAQHYSDLYSTQVKNFKEQIEFLARCFRMVSLKEIYDPRTNRDRQACITFDDGFLSVREEALPHLWSKGIPFAIFVSRMAIRQNQLLNLPDGFDRVYDNQVYLDQEDMKYLCDKGVTVGSHTASHKNLADCDDNALSEEVFQNKLYLENLIGKKVTDLALPFGKRQHYNKRVLDFCYSCGHENVYSSNPVFFDARKVGDNHRLIPRIGIVNQSNEELTFLINRPLVKRVDI